MDWTRVKFLESVENLKPLVKKRFGREPSSSLAREIVACLQQGRLFFEAGQNSPLEIRPLQLFYGSVGFAKAVILASSNRALNTLKPTHGLRDVSAGTSKIENLRVQIQANGTFQEFNDVLARLNFAPYHYTPRRFLPFSCAISEQIVGLELSLRDVLSRVVQLRKPYSLTFGEASNSDEADIQFLDERAFKLTFWVDKPLKDVTELKATVGALRKKYPFLRRMRLWEASLGEQRVPEVAFANIDNSGIDEFADGVFHLIGDFFDGSHTPANFHDSVFLKIEELGIVLFGGFDGKCHSIRDVAGHFVCNSSLHYIGLFILSSLVRYRPHTWMYALTRSVTAQASPDDQALSLIESFLDMSECLPELAVKVLNHHEDYYGSVE